jgi:hypothetical protein
MHERLCPRCRRPITFCTCPSEVAMLRPGPLPPGTFSRCPRCRRPAPACRCPGPTVRLLLGLVFLGLGLVAIRFVYLSFCERLR